MDAQSWKFIAIGLMAFGMLGAAVGVGNIFSSAVSAIARNPAVADKIRINALIGAAMAEAMGLVALLVIFLIK
jgi:F-type H+-transporting ATPase subunit c